MTKKETIAKMAKEVKESVAKNKKIPATSNGHKYAEYTYLFARTIVKPNVDYDKKEVGNAPNPNGTYISRTVKKADYINLAKNLISYINKNGKLPNYLTYNGYKIRVQVYIDAFARVVNYYYTNNKMPSAVNVNSAAFSTEKPVSNDEVFNYFVKKFGKVSTIDEALTKVKERVYGYYYDDVYSNKVAIDRMYSKSGINCTDSCQVFWHIAKALGYTVHCLHVQCSSGGHVRLKLKHPKHTKGNWIHRDPACVLSNNGKPINAIWCPKGALLGTDSSWFIANVNR